MASRELSKRERNLSSLSMRALSASRNPVTSSIIIIAVPSLRYVVLNLISFMLPFLQVTLNSTVLPFVFKRLSLFHSFNTSSLYAGSGYAFLNQCLPSGISSIV